MQTSYLKVKMIESLKPLKEHEIRFTGKQRGEEFATQLKENEIFDLEEFVIGC